MSRLINRLCGRVYGWFDSKDAGMPARRLPSTFLARAKLAVQNLEDRSVPATFTVLNTLDSGPGSLRQAFTDVNSTVGADTIVFNTNPVNGTDFDDNRNTIALLSALPTLVSTAGENVDIFGPGADKLLITRGITGALNRPITFGGIFATPLTYSMSGVTISGFSGTNSGGAIFVTSRAYVTLNEVNLSGNSGATGGAIYMNNNGKLNLNSSTISGNSSSSNGGGIRFFGTAYPADNALIITNSTLANNTGTNGGAISFQTGVATAVISNSTISGNSATSTTATVGYNGGGISRGGTTTAMSLTISSSIIANNKANATIVDASERPDIAPNTNLTISVANSLIGVSDTFTYTDGGGNQIGTFASPLTPNLSSLGFNGGRTPTMMPLAAATPITSPAIGNGLNAPAGTGTGNVPTAGVDQTGATRVAPFDIGAVEVTPGVPFGVAQPLANIFVSGGPSYTATINFYDDSAINFSTIDANDVVLISPGGSTIPATSGVVDLSSNGTPRVGTYTFTPPGGTWDSNDNGLYAVQIVANQVKNASSVAVAASFEGAFLVAIPPPTAVISTAVGTISTAGGTSSTFKITYTDVTGGGGINVSTIDNSDIRVTGPNGYDVLATFSAIDNATNGTPRIATYTIPAAGGVWNGNDNGTYTLTMQPAQVNNVIGSFVPTSTLGTFQVAAPRPTATLNPPAPATVTTPGGTLVPFSVKYTDYTGGPGIDYLSIDGSDVLVTGPGGFSQSAAFDSVDAKVNGTPRIGNYSFVPPGGSWDKADNGVYTFTVLNGSVQNVDVGNITVGTTVIGTMLVGIPQTFTVTNLNETGAGSLRQAILNANANTGTMDTINFQVGLTGTITLTAGAGVGQLGITDSVIIQGPGIANLTIDGGLATRIFNVDGATGPITVELSGMTITNGNGTNGAVAPAASDGGAILVGTTDNLSLTNVVVSNSSTTGTNDGGGIAMASGAGMLTVTASTISGNNAASDGGGIYARASTGLMLLHSTVSGNVASNATAAYGGGGIYFGGAIGSGGFTVRNSTLSSNNAASSGGGIMFRTITGNANIQNSTLAFNVASTTSAAVGAGGGGIANNSGGTINLVSSIVANNVADLTNGKNDFSIGNGTTPTINANNSLILANIGFTLSGTSSKNVIGVDPTLGSLDPNGGPTSTHLPGATSPAIDAGSNLFGLTTDQRGAGVDTVAFPRVKFLPDIGAVEAGVAPFPVITNTSIPSPITTPGGPNYTFTVTYSDASAINVSTIDSNDVMVNGPGISFTLATFVSLDTPGNGSPRTATYQVAIPGGSWDGSENGVYTISMEANQVANTPAGNFIPAQTIGTFSVGIPTTYTVTNTDDAGTGSLRDAIAQANANSTAVNVIAFSPFFNSPQTITLTSGQMAITGSLSINGPSGLVSISGNKASRIFNIDDANATVHQTVIMKNLNLINASVAGNGGAISSGESLSLTDVTISGSTITGQGAGVFFPGNGPTLTLLRTVITGNSASSNGGAMDIGPGGATVSITDSSFTNNKSSTGTIGLGYPASFSLVRSTISGNSVSGSGGGLRLYMGNGPHTIDSSTISNNTAGASGGGINIFSAGAGSSLIIRNSTVTANKASTAGGGIARTTGTAVGTMTLESTIVAGNTHASTPDMNFVTANQTISGNNNLIGVSNAGNFTLSGVNNLTGTLVTPLNPLLGGLSNNGGLTPNHSPLPGSPAINAGTNTLGLTLDQRGAPREDPTGFPDIGSVERILGVPTASATLKNETTKATSYTFTVTYANEVAMNSGTFDSNDIRVTGPLGFNTLASFVSVDSPGDGTPRTVTYSITPPGGSWDIAENGIYTVAVESGQVLSTNGKAVAAGALGTFSVTVPFEFIVTNTGDSGAGSLRQAVTDANTKVGSVDLITFDKTFFDGSAGKNLITLLSDLPIFTEGATIAGPGKSLVTISGGGLFRIFNTSTAAPSAPFSILDLTLANGSAAATGGALLVGDEAVTMTNVVLQNNTSNTTGGAVAVTAAAGSLSISNSLVQNNKSTGSGGGIALTVSGATLNATNNTFSGNKAGSNGGAIAHTTTGANLNVLNSIFTDNSATGHGGAIDVFNGSSTLNVSNSSFTGNTTNSTIGGGAIYFFGSITAFNINNTTISGNTAAAVTGNGGGGIRFQSASGTANIRNTTIAGNTAKTTTSTSGLGGGGIANTGATINLISSIVAGNSAANVNTDFSSSVNPVVSFSAIGTTSGYTLAGGSVNNVAPGTDLKLSPIATANGGTNGFTHAILTGTSPLVNAGSNPLALTTDMRGAGFDREVPTGSPDIGAFEYVPGAPTAAVSPLISVTKNLPGTNNPYTFDVTYAVETPILMDYSTINGNNTAVRVTGPGGFDVGATFVSAVPAANSSSIVASYKIAAPGADAIWDSTDNGTYNVVMQANQVKTVGTGKSVTTGTLGSFSVNVAAPAAVAATTKVTEDMPGVNNPYKFTVTYSDGNAINASSINNNNLAIRVTGPNSFDVPATFVSIDDNTNGSPRTATYQIAVPGGTWDSTDVGSYSIVMQASQVKNAIPGTFVPAGTVGTFSVVFPIIVDTELDVIDAGDGKTSLREAVELANTLAGEDIIRFSKSYFDGSVGKEKITLLSALPVMNGGVTMEGPGATKLAVDGGGAFRVFDTSISAPNTLFSFSDLTISGGSTSGTGGGLLINDEIVTLNRVVVRDSVAVDGGGINISAGTGSLTLLNSTVVNNKATAEGGGIHFVGGTPTLVIDKSTVSGNSSGAEGGGIYFFSGGSLQMTNTTLSGNTASGGIGGGGLYFFGLVSTGGFTIRNSTISGNTATAGPGGGIVFRYLNSSANGKANIISTTIAQNSASDGGGIANTSVGTTPSIRIESSIVSGNTGTNADMAILAATALSVDFSAIGVGTGFTVNGSNTNNLAFGTDLKLAALANNGGPTETHLPASDSPVVNAGSNPTPAAANDQRGLIRSVGQTDIGSVELQGAAVTVTGFTVNNGAIQRSRLTTITVTFSGTVTPASFATLGAITLTRTAATPTGVVGTIVQTGATGANGLITVSQPGPTNELVLTFSNANGANETAGVEYGSLADGRWQLAIPSAGGYSSTPGDTQLRRLFGDFEGAPGSNGTVDGNDFATFGSAFGSSGAPGFSPFDYDNNGTIDSVDLGAVGARFGFSV